MSLSHFAGRLSHASSSLPAVEILESRRLLSTTPVFTITNLVSDGAVPAAHTDKDLVNPWGVAFAPGGPFWVADNATGKATLYDGKGVKQSLEVNIPGLGGNASAPTGQVFNNTGKFNVSKSGKTGPALFIFATEDGTISGWSPSVDGKNAITVVNHSATAVYKGLALANATSGPELFATNFHDGTVDVFNSSFKQVHLAAGAFTDPSIPRGFAPFNVRNIGGQLFVTFAKQQPIKHDDQAGPFNGFVDVFDTSGKLVRRFQHGSYDNSPWGPAVAPASYGSIAGDLLVGNFGSGKIDVFNMQSGKFVGFLSDTKHQPIVENGLWALTFSTGSSTASTDTLFFSAGHNDEADGLFGKIEIDTGAKH